MKLLRRILLVTVSVLAVLVIGLLLYLAFGDLSRHKAQIEKIVTNKTGRAFTIGEPFELEVFPPSVVAENVQFANAEWGSTPAMIEVGRFAVQVDLWSLFRGPIHVRTLDLENVEILLEKNTEAEGNWTLPVAAEAEPEPEVELSDDHRPPAVIEDGHFANVRVTYREPDKEDRVVLLEALQISPGEGGLLALEGNGMLNKYPMTVQGELGTLRSLRTGRDIRLAIEADAGNLHVGVNGAVGSLNPLDGVDLALTAANPDLALMFENLGLPAYATGAMDAEVKLSDSGDRTGLVFEATLGDIRARTTGSFRRAGLTESDLNFEASVADMARLAEVFEMADVPAEELKVRGHISATRTEAALDAVVAEFVGAEARLDGTIRLAGVRSADVHFKATAPSLADLRPGLPPLPLEASGRYLGQKDVVRVSELESRLGESDLGGTVSLSGEGKPRLEAELTSRLVDLGALWAVGEKKEESAGEPAGQDPDAQAAAETAEAAEKEKKKAEKAEKKERTYVFGEEPLPLEKLEAMDVQLHLTIADLALKAGGMKDVDLLLTTEGGRLELITKAAGRVDGTVDCLVRLTPSGDAADLAVRLDARDMRSGFMAGGAKGDSEAEETVAAAEPETTASSAGPGASGSATESGGGIDPADTPRLTLELDLRSSGTSPREVASRANGHVLFTQGSGQVQSGIIDMFGAGILSQLAGRLNPFAAEDPHTDLECTVARVDIIDGQTTIEPVLMQSDKVTVTAEGTVDLHTEELEFDFNTRPRKGIGISVGMFTNPFIKLGGTLAHPSLATGAEGVASGALAVATAGISVLAKGAVDRISGEVNRCEKVLEEARSGPSESALKGQEKAQKAEEKAAEQAPEEAGSVE